jgi:hypothetical protein
MKIINCKSCGQPFDSAHHRRLYCDDCRQTPPAVYRFVCPDGRNYVGSFFYLYHSRNNHGIGRSNKRLLAAFEQHSPETWTYERGHQKHDY